MGDILGRQDRPSDIKVTQTFIAAWFLRHKNKMKSSLLFLVGLMGFLGKGYSVNGNDKSVLGSGLPEPRPLNSSTNPKEAEDGIDTTNRLIKRVHGGRTNDDLPGLFDYDALGEEEMDILRAGGLLPEPPRPAASATPTRDGTVHRAQIPTREAIVRNSRTPTPQNQALGGRDPLNSRNMQAVWVDRARALGPLSEYPSREEVNELLSMLHSTFFDRFRQPQNVVHTTKFDINFGRFFTCRGVWVNPQGLVFSQGLPEPMRPYNLLPSEGRVFRDENSGVVISNLAFPSLSDYIEAHLLTPLRATGSSVEKNGMGVMVKSSESTFAFGIRVWLAGISIPVDSAMRTYAWGSADRIIEELVRTMYAGRKRQYPGRRRTKDPSSDNNGRPSGQPLKRPRPTNTSL